MNSPVETLSALALGDRVLTSKGEHGTVVVILPDQRVGARPERARWGHLGHGVIVELDGGELIHVREPRYSLRMASKNAYPGRA